MSDMSMPPVNSSQSKNYVKKGALIGAGVRTVGQIGIAGFGISQLGKDAFFATVKKAGTGKVVFNSLLSIGMGAAIGAGIGKIVEHFKNKKAKEN